MKTHLLFIASLFFIGYCNAQLGQIHNFDNESIIYGHDSNKLTIGSNTIQTGGISDDTSLLEVTSPTYSAIRLGATNAELFFIASDQFGHQILSPQGTPLRINNIIRTDRDYVTINTTFIPTEPDYKLLVGGKIIAEGVRVELEENWADYVFTPDYSLKPLHEVEQFIKDNGHLPNIPSAATVEEEGLDLGDMVTKQMEKIEELTLYIIEQQKQIDSLKTIAIELELKSKQ